MTPSQSSLRDQTDALRLRLADAEEMLQAIRQGDIDALAVEGVGGSQVYTLHSADEPYRHLVEEMQEGAVVLTPRGDVLYSTARFAALVGEPLESVVGSRIDRYLGGSDGSDGDLLRGGKGRCRGALCCSAQPRCAHREYPRARTTLNARAAEIEATRLDQQDAPRRLGEQAVADARAQESGRE